MREETRILKRALLQIETAPWEEDHTGTLNLYTTDPAGKPVHCWLEQRPLYCDRGHFKLNIANIDGNLSLDGHDRFPRYFFTFKEADQHCRNFLKWRLWKQRISEPGWGDFGDIEVRRHEPETEEAAA